MIITEVKTQVVEIKYITTDEEDYNYYRRQGGSWEVLMGESWEAVYMKEKELELLFQNGQWRGSYGIKKANRKLNG